jgi:hypothetical protein
VQWQVSTSAGKAFTNITGATATTLSIASTTITQSGYQYRAVFTNTQGSATNTAASLTGDLSRWPSGGITATQVHCCLRAGTDVDETDVFMSGASAAEAASFILPHTFASTGTATLSCNSFGNSFGTNHGKIAALQVQSLTVNPA